MGFWEAEKPSTSVGAANRGNFQLPGFSQRDAWMRRQAEEAQGRADTSEFRGIQGDLAARLGRQVSGEDSLSNMQLRQATDANIAQQRAAAAGASPANSAMAQRLAMQNMGRVNQGLGAQAAMAGIQERNAAANALGQLAQGARGQDIQNRGLNDQYGLGMAGLGLANAQAQQHGLMGYETNQTARRGQDLSTPEQPAGWEKLLGAATAAAPIFFAEGGVVTKPTIGVVGEAGPEAIVPLVDTNAARGAVDYDWRSRLKAASGEPESHEGRDAVIKASMASDDPLIKGIGTAAGIYSSYKDKKSREGAAKKDLQSGLFSQVGRSSATGIESKLGGGRLGAAGELLGNRAPGTPYTPPTAGPYPMNPYVAMARGGIVTGPTNTLIGERGPEAVVPLGTRNDEELNTLGGRGMRFGTGSPGGGGGVVPGGGPGAAPPLMGAAHAYQAPPRRAPPPNPYGVGNPAFYGMQGALEAAGNARPGAPPPGSPYGGLVSGMTGAPPQRANPFGGLAGQAATAGGSRFMAKGGIVTEPTRTVLGEDGPEAVIPLSKLGLGDKYMSTPKGGNERPEELYRERKPLKTDRPEELYRERKPLKTDRPEELSRMRPQPSPGEALPHPVFGPHGRTKQTGRKTYGLAKGGVTDGKGGVIPLEEAPGLIERLRSSAAVSALERADMMRKLDKQFEREGREGILDRDPHGSGGMNPNAGRIVSPVSVVGHERDDLAEFPFIQRDMVRDDVAAAEDELRKAHAFRKLTHPNWGWLDR